MPIQVPKAVKVVLDGNLVKVEGPKGKLERTMPPKVVVGMEDSTIVVKPVDETREANGFHGLARTLINNMVVGVSQGFSKVLEINGVGYKAEDKGSGELQFALGYSHPILYKLPAQVSVVVEKGVKITLTSADKEALGHAAAKIRSFRPPEPYKGKGIKYSTEHIRRKAGKAGSR